MSALDNYKFSFSKSKRSDDNPNSGTMAFHLRIRKILNVNIIPFLNFDSSKTAPVRVYTSFNADGTKNYTVSVWLEESNVAGGSLLVFKDYIFSKPNVLPFENINVKVIAHLNGQSTTYTKEADAAGQPTNKNIVHDQIPVEFPIEGLFQ